MDIADIGRVEALRGNGQYTEALAFLLDRLRATPDDAMVHYQLGSTYDPQGLEDDAIPYYERALDLGLTGEHRRNCLLGLGSSYRCMERYGDAIRTLQKGAAEFPEAHEFDVFLALARYNTGEYRDAIRLLLNHIAEFSSDPATARYKRALALYAEKPDAPYDE